MTVVGVTGSRNGLTPEQFRQAKFSLVCLNPERLHHGDCLGVDAEIHNLASRLGIPVTIHPPTLAKFRANCVSDDMEPPRPFLVRDQIIVSRSDLIIAFPDGPERLRSGTWFTVRYALQRKVVVLIVSPEGTLEYR